MKSRLSVHDRENNAESEQYLSENRQKFSNQVLLLLQLLNSGMRLTVASAFKYGISSLPRRVADARANGIADIKDEWVRNSQGKKLYKEWYKEGLRPPTKKEVVEKAKRYVQPNLF